MGKNFPTNLSWIISPYNGSGRYFPFYWIYNSFQFHWFGTTVSPYYFIQSIVFLVAALLTSATLHKITGNRRAAVLLLVAIYVSSPLAENLNTLGKAEPIAYLLITCIVFAFCNTHVMRHRSIGVTKLIISTVFISPLFALAMWTKETSVALFGFCIFGIILSIVLGKFGKVGAYLDSVKDYFYLLLALFVGLCIARAPYFIFPATLSGVSYTDYAITPKLICENLVFYVQQQPDVIIFGGLALILLITAGRRLFFTGEAPDQSTARGYIFVASLCAMGWAYYLVLLAWRWPMAYYMLLPAIVFKLCTLYGIYITNMHVLIRKPLRFVVYGLVALSTIYAFFYIYYISSSQIAYSRIYSEALQKYKNMPGEKKALIMESYPFYAEQVGGTGRLLLVDKGTNFRVKGIADVLDPAVTTNIEILKLLNVSRPQLEENINNLPKRDDYLLTITGSKLATWFLRGVTPYYNEDSLLKMQGAYDMVLVAERQIKIPALYLHIWTNHLVAEETSVGYKLYKVVDEGPKFLWRGRYPDGWIGKEASLQVNTTYHQPVVIKLSAPNFALPNKVTIRKDGHLFKELELTGPDEKVLLLNGATQKPTVYQFGVQNAVVPKNIHLNKDTRELGLRITLETVSNISR